MASELGLAILAALGGGVQGFSEVQERNKEREQETFIETERLLESRRGRRETIEAGREEGEKDRAFRASEGEKDRAAAIENREDIQVYQSEEGARDRGFRSEESEKDRALNRFLEAFRAKNALQIAGIRSGEEPKDTPTIIAENARKAYEKVLEMTGDTAQAMAAATQARQFWTDYYADTGIFNPTPKEEDPAATSFNFRGLGVYGLPVDALRALGTLQPGRAPFYMDPSYEPFLGTVGPRARKKDTTRTLK